MKVILTVQLALGARTPVHVPPFPVGMLYGEPVDQLKYRTPAPEFVMVKVCGELAVFLFCVPKLIEVGERLITGTTPVPLNGMVCGDPEALSVTDRLAERLPWAPAWNVT